MTMIGLLARWLGVGILSYMAFLALAFCGGAFGDRSNINKAALTLFNVFLNAQVLLIPSLFVASLVCHFYVSMDVAVKVANYSFAVPILGVIYALAALGLMRG